MAKPPQQNPKLVVLIEAARVGLDGAQESLVAILRQALKDNHGHVLNTATALGLSRSQMIREMRRYKLRKGAERLRQKVKEAKDAAKEAKLAATAGPPTSPRSA